MEPGIPLPRLLGHSTRPIRDRDPTAIRIYPEERGHRIDICWQRRGRDLWLALDRKANESALTVVRRYGGYRAGMSSIKIAKDEDIAAECPDFDLFYWRQSCFVLKSRVLELLDVFGMTPEFGTWVGHLVADGDIPESQRSFLKEQLVAAKGERGAELLSDLNMPPERVFGRAETRRASHLVGYGSGDE